MCSHRQATPSPLGSSHISCLGWTFFCFAQLFRLGRCECPGHGRYGGCKAHTRMGFAAGWAPPHSGKPSTATSSLRPSTRSGSKSRSHNITFVVIRPLACRHFLHSPTCSAENSSPCASCARVATEVEREATPAETHGQRKRQMKTTQEDDAGNLGVERGDTAHGIRGQG